MYCNLLVFSLLNDPTGYIHVYTNIVHIVGLLFVIQDKHFNTSRGILLAFWHVSQLAACVLARLAACCLRFNSDSDSVFISIIRIYTRTSTAFTMGGIVLRTIVDIG